MRSAEDGEITEKCFFRNEYVSPLGKITMYSDGENLVCLALEKQRAIRVAENAAEENLPVFGLAARWLDLYFAGKNPCALQVPVRFTEGSDFARRVWEILSEIPYGRTTTYGEIARRIEKERGTRMSAQAVGGAVGRNPVAIIVPCHRVLGAGGALTGYQGGLDYKRKLLGIEKIRYKDR